MPDAEVVVKAQRRHFSAEYKRRVLQEADAWNFGGGSAVGSGSLITHLFPLTFTIHSYAVTLPAANACGTALVLKSLTVQPQTVFLPLVRK